MLSTIVNFTMNSIALFAECKRSHNCYVNDYYEKDGNLTWTSRGCNTEGVAKRRGVWEETWKALEIDYEKIEEKGQTCLKAPKSSFPMMVCWRICNTDLCNGNRYREEAKN